MIARKLADGRIEFAIRQKDGVERFPLTRFFAYETAPVDKWLLSSEVMIDSYDGPVGARMTARRLSSGQIEFQMVSTHKIDVLIGIFDDKRFVNYAPFRQASDLRDRVGDRSCQDYSAHARYMMRWTGTGRCSTGSTARLRPSRV